MDLFSARAAEIGAETAPLAARMRPRNLDEFVGQAHVLGPDSALRALIEADELRSVILWGPAGTGKTSLAQIVARATRSHFEELSATSAGVKDVRAVLEAARQRLGASGRRTILFIDEIHRFNKAQQDALLPGVEDRIVVLIGATTENPFFALNTPLMSRSLLFRLEPLSTEELETIVRRALADAERGLGGRGLTLDDDALAHLVDRADGDARHALNALEAAALVVTARTAGAGEGARVTLADIEDALQRPRVTYDRAGDQHYDVASAFIKSIRGSDPDAALHYLARMLAAGEDPRFVARRLVI
ncbi:MAG TPA: AAA family ATPase, partial [Actinomycetota bacterium]